VYLRSSLSRIQTIIYFFYLFSIFFLQREALDEDPNKLGRRGTATASQLDFEKHDLSHLSNMLPKKHAGLNLDAISGSIFCAARGKSASTS